MSLLLRFDLLVRSPYKYFFGEAANIENERCHMSKDDPIDEGEQGAREIFRHKLIEEREHFN